jgi:hypothetical protein
MSNTPKDGKPSEAVLAELAEIELEFARKLVQMGREAKTTDEAVRLADAFELTALSIMSSVSMAAELAAERADSADAAPGEGDGGSQVAGISLAELERKPTDPLQ